MTITENAERIAARVKTLDGTPGTFIEGDDLTVYLLEELGASYKGPDFFGLTFTLMEKEWLVFSSGDVMVVFPDESEPYKLTDAKLATQIETYLQWRLATLNIMHD